MKDHGQLIPPPAPLPQATPYGPPYPPYGPPHPPYGQLPPYGTGWNGKTNGFSIAALVMALLGCTGVLSVVFGFIGLSQSRRNGDRRGRTLAIAALTISALWLTAIAGLVGYGIVRDIADGPDRDTAGILRGERSIKVTDLRPGDCVKDLYAQSGDYIDAVPCSTPHDSELFATFELSLGLTEAETETADNGCEKRFAPYSGQKLPKDAKFTVVAFRVETGSALNDLSVLCFAHQRTGTTTGSIKL